MAAARVIGKALPRCRAALGRKGNCRGFSSGGRSSDDLDVQALLSDIPPSKSKNAASSEAGPKMWESVMKEPSQASISPEWDFLGELHASQLKHSQNRFSFSSSSSKASTSSRSLADDGFDFLAEDHQRPSPSPKEPALEPRDLPEQNLFHAASFKLIRDTFAKAPSDTGKKLVRDSLGGDSSALFFEPSSKEVDPRSLAEVEDGRFFSTKDPALTLKTYTYAELGEKLRNARPPKEQILSSAVGLSFGELRTRIQTIEAEEYKDTSQEFWDLKASLAELKSFKKDPTRQLSYQELAFVDSHGGRQALFQSKIEYTPPNDELLTKYYSETQLSSKERLKLEIKKLKEEFQTHDYDSGSPQVQIAILTARINNLNRHMREGRNYKRDKHSRKGLNDMVQYRKRMLRYLRRRDWPAYCNVLTKLKLDDVILEKRH